jgi:hypothetical protein
MGNSLPQRELLSGDTNLLGVAAGRLFHLVTITQRFTGYLRPVPILSDVLSTPDT